MERAHKEERCEYCQAFERFSENHREFLEGFRTMTSEFKAKNPGNCLDNLATCRGEYCHENKILLEWSPTLLGAYREFVGGTYKIAKRRKYSWYGELIRIWEARQVNSPLFTIESDEEGEIDDFAEENPGWPVPFNPPCPLKSKKDPGEMLIAEEDFAKVINLLKEIGNSRLKYRREYQLILLWLVFEGINDNQVIAQRLGIEKNKAKDLKHQAKKLLKKLAAKRYPELFEKQKAYENQEEEHEFVRSTGEERRANYRTYNPEEIIPGEPKIWKGEEAERYLEQLKLKRKKTNLS